MATAGGAGFAAEHPPRPPDDVELKTIIDKLANFVARNGPEFEQMTMNKQRDNSKFQFLFGGEWHAYYKWRVMSEHQGQGSFQSQPGGGGGGNPPGAPIPPLIRPLMSVGSYPQLPPNLPPFPPPPLFGGPRGFPPGFVPNMPPLPLLPPSAPTSSQSQPQSINAPWQQHQAPPTNSQAPPTNSQTPPTAPTHQLQLVRQELQKELETYGVTDAMEIEFGKVVKQLMDSCTKDSIASGKSWILSHSELPNECAKVAKLLLRKTLDSPGVGFAEKLHIIYLINDVIHHCARKGAEDLLQAVEDLVVQMVYNVHCSSSGRAESLQKVCKIWDTQKYFSDTVLEQIQAIVTDEPRGHEVREPEVKDDQQSHPWDQRDQPPQPPWQQSSDQQNQKPPPPWQQQPQPDQRPQPPWQQQPQPDQKPQLPWQQQPQPDQKLPPWQQQPQPDQQQNQPVVPGAPWQQDTQRKPPFMPWQQQSQPHPWDKPQDSNKPPIMPWEQQHPPPPWPPRHPEGPRMPPWSGPPGLPPPPWQQGPPCVGEPTPLFPPAQPGDPPSHPPSQDSGREERGERESAPAQDEERNENTGSGPGDSAPLIREGSPDLPRHPMAPHEEDGGPHRDLEGDSEGGHGMMRSFDYQHGRQFGTEFGENCRDEGPPPPREIFDYNHRPPHWDLPPPPHLPPMPPRMPPFDAWGPPPPHLPPPPDLPPPLPYYDLPAGLMVAVVPLFEHGYRPLDARDIHLPPPQPPSERLLCAVEEFYKTPSDDKPRNEEGWEARALLDFYEAKHRAKTNRYRPMRRQPPRRPRSRSRSRSRSYSRSPPPRRRRSRSHSRSPSHSQSRPLQSRSRSHSPSRRYSDEQSRSHSRSPRRSRQRRSRSRSPFVLIAEERPLPPLPQSMAVGSESKIGGSNVGHQLLKKMGWEEGAGLGLREQGIQEPIKGGEVRDKNDKYKGVGMDMRDPFELFRKNKSYTFNRRAPPPPPSP